MGLGPAELVDLRQKLFDAAADLLTLGAQGLDFRGKLRGMLHRGFLLLAQPVDELHGLMNPLFETAERVGLLLLVEQFHRCYPPALTLSVSSRKPGSSCMATSARTLRSRLMPISFSPCMNLLK